MRADAIAAEPTFRVPARYGSDDWQEGREWSDLYVDQLDEMDLWWLSKNSRAELLDVIDWALALDRAEQCADVVTLHAQEPRSETERECAEEAALAAE